MIDSVTLSQEPTQKAPHPVNRRARTLQAFVVGLAVISIYGVVSVIPAHFDLWTATKVFFTNLQLMFFSPNVGNDSHGLLFQALLASIELAFVTTVLGAGLGLVCGLAAAQNIAPSWLCLTTKSVMAFVRAIPTILWVLIYSVALGLGPNAAVVGLTFHSVAYLAKVFANTIEEIPAPTIEALRAGGCGLLPVLCQAVLPSLASRLLSWTFIRFEINFANAVVVGAAAGAGGIGYQLFVASNFYFNFHEVGMIVYYILAFVFVLEMISTKLRHKFID